MLPQVRPVTANRAQSGSGHCRRTGSGRFRSRAEQAPRLSASVLLGTTAINTYVQYQSADASTKETKSNRRNVFKNLSLVGAVIILRWTPPVTPPSHGAPATSRTILCDAAKVWTPKSFNGPKAVQDAVQPLRGQTHNGIPDNGLPLKSWALLHG